MSLVIWFCLAGVCKVHEIPLQGFVDPMTCFVFAQVKIVELGPSYQGHTIERVGCIKGVTA
jgi:hypothetical protein